MPFRLISLFKNPQKAWYIEHLVHRTSKDFMNDELNHLLQTMQAQLTAQGAELQALRSQKDGTSSKPQLVLGDTLAALVAPHLQLAPTDAGERKRIMGSYPKINGFPEPIRDDNGMAARAISDSEQKKWITERLPAVQRDHLDVARVAAATWEMASMCQDPNQRLQFFDTGIKDIIALSINCAQRAAETQLKQSFKGAGAEGSYSLLDLSPNTLQLDMGDNNVFQQAHLDAMAELRKFKASIDANKKADSSSRGGGGGKGNGHGGRGSGKGYNNNYQSRGGGYGGGKGKGYGGGKGGQGKGGGKGSWQGNGSQSPRPMDP
jgi:hypothetical protein